LSRSTHGGAVVFRLTRRGPRYLLVEASRTRDRWVFPKGRVEDGETVAATALREVAEEAGVRVQPIRRLRRVEQKQGRESISIAYFLTVYVSRTAPSEERKIRWLGFDEAIEALDLVVSRSVLRSAHRTISLASGEKPARGRKRSPTARVVDWVVVRARALLPRRPRGAGTKARVRRPASRSRVRSRKKVEANRINVGRDGMVPR